MFKKLLLLLIASVGIGSLQAAKTQLPSSLVYYSALHKKTPKVSAAPTAKDNSDDDGTPDLGVLFKEAKKQNKASSSSSSSPASQATRLPRTSSANSLAAGGDQIAASLLPESAKSKPKPHNQRQRKQGRKRLQLGNPKPVSSTPPHATSSKFDTPAFAESLTQSLIPVVIDLKNQTPDPEVFEASSSTPETPEASSTSSPSDPSSFTFTRPPVPALDTMLNTPEHPLTLSEDSKLFGDVTPADSVSDNFDSFFMSRKELEARRKDAHGFDSFFDGDVSPNDEQRDKPSTSTPVSSSQIPSALPAFKIDDPETHEYYPKGPDGPAVSPLDSVNRRQNDLEILPPQLPGTHPTGQSMVRNSGKPASTASSSPAAPTPTPASTPSIPKPSTKSPQVTDPATPPAAPAKSGMNISKVAGLVTMLAGGFGTGKLAIPELKKAHKAVMAEAEKAKVTLTWPAYLKAMAAYFKADIKNRKNRKKYALMSATTLATFAGLGIALTAK